MKQNIFKKIGLVLCILVNIHTITGATTTTINGLVYSLSGTTATIIDFTNDVAENLVIPETIIYNGDNYRVKCIGNRQYGNSSWAVTGAFFNCTKLKSLVVPSSVTSIVGKYHEDPDNAPVLDGQVFYGCTNLQYVRFQGSIDIGANAFYGCRSLQTIVFEKKLTINKCAFWKCTSLKYIVLPAETNISIDAFTECNILQDIICLGNVITPTNLTNVNYFTKNDLLSWEQTTYTYSGRAPQLPSFTNNVPRGFTPTINGNINLQKIVGQHSVDVSFTFSNDDMSFDVDIPYNYTINPVTLHAKVNNASRFYGDENPQFTTTYTGFVNNENASVLTSQGSYSTTATATSDIGTYVIKQTDATAQNYVFEYEDGTMTVNKAPLTMSANNKTITYGNSIPALDVRYEGLKNNETVPVWTSSPNITTTATPKSNVGTYPITISNAVPKNYELTINNGTLTVEKASLNVKVNNKTRKYGEANPEFTLSYTGLKNNETEPEWEIHPTFETLATIQSGVGTYPISVTNAVAVNYNLTISNGTLSINKATLTAKANNTNREYGEDNPSFNVTYLGFVCDDDETALTTSPNMSTSATKASNVGEYPIIISGGAATNYNIVYESGVLTVTKAPLSAMVNDATKVYGANNPSFTISYYGLKNGETAPAWTTSPTFQTEATKRSGVGQYTVNAINGVPKNYDLGAITPGTLTITPAPLTIKANNAVRQYYTDNPTFSYTCNGFVNNENNSILSPVPTLSTTATQTSNVGTYEISVEGASSPNYSISYTNGTLTITPRTLMASVGNYSRPYNEENPEFEVLYSGFVGNDDKSVLNEEPVASTTAIKTSDVGTYQIYVSGGDADNYTFSYTSGILTINKAEQTITWNQDFSNSIIMVGDQIELQAVASSGLPITYTINNDNIAEVYTAGSKTYLDCFGTGDVQILAIQEGNQNYYSSPRVRKVITIDNDDAISSIDESEVKIQSSSFGVKVTGVNKGEMVRVYTVDGKLRHSIEADSQSIDIPLKKGGIYIIQFKDGTKKKVLIK